MNLERIAVEITPSPYPRAFPGFVCLRVDVFFDGRRFHEVVHLTEDELVCQFDRQFGLARGRLKRALLAERRKRAKLSKGRKRSLAKAPPDGIDAVARQTLRDLERDTLGEMPAIIGASSDPAKWSTSAVADDPAEFFVGLAEAPLPPGDFVDVTPPKPDALVPLEPQ